jgi:hypothetical protein
MHHGAREIGSLAKSAHTLAAARASGEFSFFVSVLRRCVDQHRMAVKRAYAELTVDRVAAPLVHRITLAGAVVVWTTVLPS